MALVAPNALSGGRGKPWLPISIIALVAVSAGLIVPQMLPALSAVPQASSGHQSSKKDDLAYTPPAWPDGPDPKAMILRLVLGTILVLGLCAGTLLAGKRWLRGMPAKTVSTGPLQLVDSLNLGNRCSVHLIGAGQRHVLVGIDASGLKTLVPLPDSFVDALGSAQADEPPSVPAVDPVERHTLDERGRN